MRKIATIKEAYERSEMAGSSDSNKCITKSEALGIANLEVYGDYADIVKKKWFANYTNGT